MRISIPIVCDLHRLRLGNLTSALDSLFKNSSVEHDVVIVSQDALEPEFRGALVQWPVNIVQVRGAFVLPDNSGNNLYAWLNEGARHAETDWILTPAGDDSYFFPGWEVLIDEIEPQLKDSAIWTPFLFETYPHHFHRVTFDRPAEMRVGWVPPKMLESEVLKFTEHCTKTGTSVEKPHERTIAHWANTVQHRDLFWRAGGFKEIPPCPESHDLHLHDTYSELGVTKYCVTESRIGNCRVPIELGR